MAIFRDEFTLGNPSRIQTLLQQLEASVAAANASASEAATSATNSETSYNTFNNIYLGPFASDPTTDNDSSALEAGDLYFNTTTDVLKVYDGAAWLSITTGGVISTDFKYFGAAATDPTVDTEGNVLATGDLYYNTATSALKVYNGTAWAVISPDPQYLGSAATDPTTDSNGNAVATGDLYYNTTSNVLKEYNGTSWVDGDYVLYAGLTAELPCVDQVVSRPEIKDYSETTSSPTSSAGALTLDLTNGNVFTVTLTENITTLTLSNPPATGKAGSFTLVLTQDATGSRTVTWPASVKWAGSTAPALSTAASSIDVLTFLTTNAGTSWYGFLAGGGMA